MEYAAQKLLIFILIFSSISLLVWAGVQVVQEVLREYEKHYVTTTSKALTEMFIFQDPRKLFLLNIGITLLFLFIGLLVSRNVIYIALFGAFGFSIPRFLIWQARKNRLERFASQLVDGLTVLSNALRSGMSFLQAIEVLEAEQGPPISQEFGLVLRENKLGVPLEEALKNLTVRIPNDDLQLIVSSITIILGMGGNLTESFDSIAHVIRERTKIEGKTKALTSQGKLQGLVVGFLPTALGILMYFMDPPMMERMITTTIGMIALGVMVALQITGYFLIRKVTNIEI